MSNSPILNIPGIENGTADGNTLRWESSTGRWEENTSLVVADNGNVGIGNTTPGVPLIVATEEDGNGQTVRVVNTTANRQITLGAGTAAAGVPVWQDTSYIDASGDLAIGAGGGGLGANILFYTNTGRTEKMRITSAGNVGIGTAVPADDPNGAAVLQVGPRVSRGVLRATATSGGYAELNLASSRRDWHILNLSLIHI